jgi:hypothetical protein
MDARWMHDAPHLRLLDPPPRHDEGQALGAVVVEQEEGDIKGKGEGEEYPNEGKKGLDRIPSSIVEEGVGDLSREKVLGT